MYYLFYNKRKKILTKIHLLVHKKNKHTDDTVDTVCPYMYLFLVENYTMIYTSVMDPDSKDLHQLTVAARSSNRPIQQNPF